MKIYGNLERASLESLSSNPSAATAGRVWWNTVDGKAYLDSSSVVRPFLLNDDKVVIGNAGTAADNVRLHRGAAGVLQFLEGDDVTAEGTLSTNLNQISARLENYTDAGKPAAGNAGRMAYITDLGKFQGDNGSAWASVILNDGKAVFGTNGTAANNVRLHRGAAGVLQFVSGADTTAEGTLSTALNQISAKLETYTFAGLPAAGNAGRLAWVSDLSSFYGDNGSAWVPVGSGGQGGINYILNPDAEVDASGWDAYADAAGTSPVDGTGGSPTLTITRSTSAPLREDASYLITKDAANRQGEGISYDFTIDDADLAKPLAISFDYEPSANFVAGDSSDLRAWIYDVTNAQLIQPAPYTIQGGSGAKHRFIGTFQTASNSNSYRLILHVATTNASAWTFKFDNVLVGPQVVNYGSPITDFQLKTVSIDNITISTQVMYFRRVGDSLECWGSYTPSGSSASPWALVLPDGLSVDSAKIAANSQVGQYWQLQAASTTLYASGSETNIVVFYDGTNNTKLFTASALASNAFTKLNGSNMSNTPQRFWFKVPIAGWSSTVEMSNDTDTRVVAARAYRGSSDQAIASSAVTKVLFNAISHDTHGAFDSVTNNRYDVKVPGTYEVSVSLELSGLTAGQDATIRIYKNGVEYSQGFFQVPTGGFLTMNHYDEVQCVAGDYLEIYVSSGGDTSYNVTFGSTLSFATFSRKAGPAAIAASEKVSAIYTTDGQAISDNTTTIIDFDTVNKDSHGSVTTGASWKFTAQSPGDHEISATLKFQSGNFGGANIKLMVYKNGSLYKYMGGYDPPNASAHNYVQGSALVPMIAGDYIDVRVLQNSSVTMNLETAHEYNHVNIHRV